MSERRAPRRILVTGGCGFVGSAFVRWLLSHRTGVERVVNLDALTYAGNVDNVATVAEEPRYTFVHGDINDTELVGRQCDEHEIDTIVHFAAESHVDRSIDGPLVFVTTNVLGTASLLEVVRARPHLHLHHVSTDEVFGSLGSEGSFREGSPYRPSSPYAASKASADHLVRAYARTYGISVTISNASNNYGPFQFAEKLIPLMIGNMLRREPLPIYADGSNVRDWLYVDDHADAVWRIVERGRAGETYLVGGGGERTNLELVRALVAEVARQTEVAEDELAALVTFVEDRPGHDFRYAIDADKLRRELGWAPAQALTAGLALTVGWYLSHPEWFERAR